MTSEHSRLYYSCIFLHVSFQAVLGTVENSSKSEDTPCWLDAQLLGMLSDELQRCRSDAAPLPEVCQALDTAIYHCSLLMAQCPAAVNRQLCRHHLEAIMMPLKEASSRLSNKAGPAASQRSAGQRLRGWLGW
ncbi:hypothetical protein FGL86_08655 [Pistricoccus aurantiacus]|uniref:Uncharacterized protein n=1 Tax=Pistricoccus aurantiacus TaxID=1883414 RepID=A0A5B8ST04_9GAMM|nr:hypothetical protein [Pistricoccus aurantiacus]QEA39137.1 hypothetical protein FGL86_08655 [Pistricoccus aurantiacus]